MKARYFAIYWVLVLGFSIGVTVYELKGSDWHLAASSGLFAGMFAVDAILMVILQTRDKQSSMVHRFFGNWDQMVSDSLTMVVSVSAASGVLALFHTSENGFTVSVALAVGQGLAGFVSVTAFLVALVAWVGMSLGSVAAGLLMRIKAERES